MLLKGLIEVRDATRPIAACEMALIRLAYAADLPPTDKLVRDLLDNPPLEGGSKNSSGARNFSGRGPAALSGADPSPKSAAQISTLPQGEGGKLATAPTMSVDRAPLIRSLEDIVALADPKSMLKVQIESYVRLVRLEPGMLEFSPAPGAPRTLASDLSQKLRDWTGTRWVVTLARDGGMPTLSEQKKSAKAARLESVMQEPLVRAVLDRFPGAEVIAVRDVVAEEIVAAPTTEDDA
jgi:DNA polymerase-3 subunit gamma/tau